MAEIEVLPPNGPSKSSLEDAVKIEKHSTGDIASQGNLKSEIELMTRAIRSTRDILIKLFRELNKIPFSIADEEIISSVILSMLSTQSMNALKKPNGLDQAMNDMEFTLKLLEGVKSPAAKEIRENYKFMLEPMKKDIQDKMAERKKLLEQEKEALKTQSKILPEIYSKLAEKKISAPELKQTIREFRAKQDEITAQVAKLTQSEQAIKATTDPLREEIANVVTATMPRKGGPQVDKNSPE